MSNPAVQDMEALREEWETSEALLALSQKDNKEKHHLIESYKQYVKELEKLLESSYGPAWKIDHHFTSPSLSIPMTTASTPIPKPTPSSLRYSTSVSNKRSSRTLGRLVSLREQREDLQDATPTGAMKRLQGRADPTIASGEQDTADEVHNCNQAMRLLLDELERGLMRKEAAIVELSLAARRDWARLGRR